MKKEPAPVRFWRKVNVADACWTWQAGKDWHGYGKFQPVHGKNVMAHRFAYELLRGPIPEGLTIDHLCRNRACVNPNHMEPVPLQENIRRGEHYHTLALYCKRGHPLVGANLIPNKSGFRHCRVCRNARRRERRRLGLEGH